jgi:cell growth-regulating nucleolar protein
MVFFVCEGCNESLKKNKVDAHAARCRNCWAVSCVDCSVVFKGNDYAAHTSCMSEAQKYEGSLYKAKAKKMSPQERWMDVVAHAKTADAKLQNVLDRVAGYDNVPRKKPKFVNFMKNSIAMHDATVIEKVWTVLDDAYKAAEQEAAAAAAAEQEAKKTEETNGASDLKKRKPDEKEPDAEKENGASKKSKTEETDKPVKWAKLIKAALKKAPAKEMELSALREQLLQHVRSEKLSTRDDKALKKELKEALRATSDAKFAVVEIVRLTE